jgi:Trk K+ transport system NAD-binding subunit
VPIHIDEMSTEVLAEQPAPQADAAATVQQDDEVARVRATLARTVQLAWRTQAEGFDD